MKTTKQIAIVSLLLAAVLSLSSCIGFGSIIGRLDGNDGTISRDELEDIIDDRYQQGDNYDITINASGDGSLVAARHAVLSVVSVAVQFESGSASGAGVIFKLDKEKGDAYIVTNYHVVYDSAQQTNGGIGKDINVYLYGQEYSDYAIGASYVGGAMSYDLAVLKVEGSEIIRGSSAIATKFANSDEISILDTAIAIGNPKGMGISATVGHVSVDSENTQVLVAPGKLITLRVIRMDTPVNHGNSGGGLFNENGELIGIVNAKYSGTAATDIGYAIPSNIVRNVAESILYYCDGKAETSMYRCLLGITVQQKTATTEYDTESGKILKRERVEILDINLGSLAEEKFKIGDELLSVKVGGKEYDIVRVHSVVDAMLNARVGDKVETVVKRNGERLTVVVEITEAALTKVE